ncbi:MAG TPA: VWA domain-containing protein [Gaiellaceae bacterium]|nr:VWA domain-containing protein [Gaiellaceae bacterium]
MTFAAPYLLFTLLAVPVAAIGYLLLERRRTARASAWSTRAMMPNIVRRPSERLRYVPAALMLIGLTFLLVGFARPQRVLNSVKSGATVVLAFDVSGSMASSDVHPTRIMAARNGAIQFLNTLPSKYQVAVVTFADKVNLVVAPTTNRSRVIAGLPTQITPLGGTAIGDAIDGSLAVAVRAVGKSHPGNPHPPAAILLISDGSQTAQGTKPQDAAAKARLAGIPVDTISVGTANGQVTQQQKLQGGQVKTQTYPVPVDPTTLQVVSHLTGGQFFKAFSAQQLSQVYRNLGTHTSKAKSKRELSALATGIALVFILSGVVLSALWFRRFA